MKANFRAQAQLCTHKQSLGHLQGFMNTKVEWMECHLEKLV